MVSTSRWTPPASANLKTGTRLPGFVLPSTSGGTSGPPSMRSKYNLVLAFVEASPAGEAYLYALAAANGEIGAEQARVLAVVPLPLVEAKAMYSRLGLPFPLLADEGAAVTGRMLGEGNRAGLCIADRYGEAFHVEAAPGVEELSPPQTGIAWLEYIQVQCPE